MKFHALIWLFICTLTLWVCGACSGRRGPVKEVSIAYLGRYTNLHDTLPREQQVPSVIDRLHEAVVRDYLEQLNQKFPEYRFSLKTFDCAREPAWADSIYRNQIIPDSSIILVIDNTWGVDLTASSEGIRRSNIPVIATNGDRNNNNFGANAIFTGNDDRVPHEIAVFASQILNANKVNFITETDYALHDRYLGAFETAGINVGKQFSILGKQKYSKSDSLAILDSIRTWFVQHPEQLDVPLVVNTHMVWGNRILRYLDAELNHLTILGHAYITNVANTTHFGASSENTLILMTSPTDAVSFRLQEDIQRFRAEDSLLFGHINAGLFIKRCYDAINILEGLVANASVTGPINRMRIGDAMQSLRNGRIIVQEHLYEFDSSLVLYRDQNFTAFSGGRLTSYPRQLNHQEQVIPNLFFGMEIIDIYEIDLNSNSFSADFYYWIKVDTGSRKAENLIIFQNLKQSESSRELIVEKTEGNILYKLYKVSGRFFVNFRLTDYPLDQQELTIEVEILNPSEELRISFDQESFAMDPATLEQFKIRSWDKDRYLVTVDERITEAVHGDPTQDGSVEHTYKRLVLHLFVSRRFIGPFLEIILPLILIGIVAISLLYVRNISFENLGEVSAGTFLGIIAFSIALSNITPSSDALTKADLLFWFTFLVVLISFMTVIVVNSIYTEEQVRNVSIRPVRIILTILYPVAILWVLLG